MLCPRPTPFNERAMGLNLLGADHAQPPAQRVRSSANSGHLGASGGTSDPNRPRVQTDEKLPLPPPLAYALDRLNTEVLGARNGRAIPC